MDYTSLDEVHNAMQGDSTITGQDTALSEYVTKASRLIDSLCTGVNDPMTADYFTQADVIGEILTNGAIDVNGDVTFYPHKYNVTAVASFNYRYRLHDSWTAGDPTYINIEGEGVRFEGYLSYAERIYIQVNYNGGLANVQTALPLDFIDLATMIAVRLYKEARGNYTDAIGIAELGTMIYTKAFPARFLQTLPKYTRTAPWT